MGNECDQCQAVTQGCKRQQFRTELKNREKLDISRAQAHSKSRSKLEPLLALRSGNGQQDVKEQVKYVDDEGDQESLEIVKNRKLQEDNQEKSKGGLRVDDRGSGKAGSKVNKSSNQKEKALSRESVASSLENKTIQNLKKSSNLSQSDRHGGFSAIKLPIQSGIENKNLKKLQQLQKALLLSREPPKISDNKKKPSSQTKIHQLNHDNSTVHIVDPIMQQSRREDSDKENSFNRKPALKNTQQSFSKIRVSRTQVEGVDNIKSVLKRTGSFEKGRQINERYHGNSKQQQQYQYQQHRDTLINDSQILQSLNPSKVLREFNTSLQQSPINPTHTDHHQPKSPINHQESELPYDQQSITSHLQTIEQCAFYLKPGVYFEGYISSVTKKLSSQGTLRFEFDHTEMMASFKDGQVDGRKNVVMAFQDGSAFEGAIRKEGDKGEVTASGQGKFIMSDESFYVGEWMKNLPHGKGKHMFPDGSFYQGEFIEGRKQGQGKFATSQGDLTYQGSFLNNHIEGYGQMSIIQPNTGKKRIYKGYFKNGKLQGNNCQVQYVQQKAKYVGGFHDGKKSGHGKYYYGDGRVWEGEWKHNRQNGYGKLSDGKGGEVEGYWVDGIKSEGRQSRM